MITELSKEAKEKRNTYQREWRTKNKDRVKAINHRYWENKVKATEKHTNKGDEIHG